MGQRTAPIRIDPPRLETRATGDVVPAGANRPVGTAAQATGYAPNSPLPPQGRYIGDDDDCYIETRVLTGLSGLLARPGDVVTALVGHALGHELVEAAVTFLPFEDNAPVSPETAGSVVAGMADHDHPEFLALDGSRQMTGDLDMGGKAITDVGLVDGVDLPTLAADVDGLETDLTTLSDAFTAHTGGGDPHPDYATDTDLSDHASDTTTHGVSGNIVGDSDTQALSNKTLDGTCDLGALAGAKGNLFAFQCSAEDTGAGLTAVASFIDGQHMDLPEFVMPVDCKVVGIGGNVQHDNGTDPGDWRVVLQNVDGGTVVRNNVTMDNVGLASNPFAGGLSGELAFSAGHRLRFYMDGPACDHVRFRLLILFATT